MKPQSLSQTSNRQAMTLNPDILTWARDTAGLSADEAARALGFNDTRNRSAVQRLMALETGQEQPSRSVLLKMAQAYRRPLLVFYLAQPPRIGDRGHDFRTGAILLDGKPVDQRLIPRQRNLFD